MEAITSEVTVIGAGAAGLWASKQLIDEGYKVTLVEREDTIASGASTRNEGWLHAGTYHSVGIVNKSDAEKVVQRTLYGHNETVKFAPETINEDRSLCFTYSEEIAAVALSRWRDFDVKYSEISPKALEEEGIDCRNVVAAFEVADKSINTNRLYKKLAGYILQSGSRIFTGTPFKALDHETGLINVDGEDIYLQSEKFVATSGAGLREIAKDVTGRALPMRFYKAHLLVGPQLTDKNCFSLDVGEAGIMNHGSVSVIGINRDGIELESPDYDVDDAKVALLHSAVGRAVIGYGASNHLQSKMIPVACCKPDVYSQLNDVQSLNAQLFPLSDSYIGALPGKMTETPYLARLVTDFVASSESTSKIIPIHARYGELKSVEVALRPADIWLRSVHEAS